MRGIEKIEDCSRVFPEFQKFIVSRGFVMEDIKNYTLEGLKEFLKNKGYPAFYARQIFDWIYKKRIENFDLMSNISKEGRQCLKDNFCFSGLNLLKRECSCDGTEKFLFKLEDASMIETALIPEGVRNTLCVSTQVGCKFKCRFCASGKEGFKRNLTVSEITNQYLSVSKAIFPNKITNIVFMGIGEPLDNFANTIKAIKILMHPAGIHLGKRKISISTCGLVPEIKKLADLNLGVKLSVSLHSPDNAVRGKLMPVNNKYPLSELMKTAKQFVRLQKYPVTFEYVLIQNINTKKDDAYKLAKLLRGIKAKVNLIPFNFFNSGFKSPSAEEIDNFSDELKKRGVFSIYRRPRGRDINAACGQLQSSFKRKDSL